MDRFLEMRAFAAVAEAGSFSKAADVLVISKAAVSRQVSELESRLGVRLLHRTSRRVSLTEQGQLFHARCRELLSEVDEAESEITIRSGSTSGLVRLCAPVSFGNRHLAPLWGEFMSLHPRVTLEVTLTDRFVDVAEEGYDLSIRIAGEPAEALAWRRLTSTHLVACASSLYLDQHGTPVQPGDLARHKVVAHRNAGNGDMWHFEGPDGKVDIRTRPCMMTNSAETCRAAALAHLGVVLLPGYLVAEDLQSGRLVELFPAFRGPASEIYAVYPTRKFASPKVQALVDFLAGCFQAHRPAW
jgi:DNA-binding transcriptional LysR family regulator